MMLKMFRITVKGTSECFMWTAAACIWYGWYIYEGLEWLEKRLEKCNGS